MGSGRHQLPFCKQRRHPLDNWHRPMASSCAPRVVVVEVVVVRLDVRVAAGAACEDLRDDRVVRHGGCGCE